MEINSYFYSDAELELMKQHFADNEPLLKLLRKVLVPQYHDTSADIGGLTNDMFNHTDFDIRSYPSESQAFIGGAIRRGIIQLVENQLWNMKMLAGQKKETLEETKARLAKNSNK